MDLTGLAAFIFFFIIMGIVLAIIGAPFFISVALASRLKRKANEYQKRADQSVITHYDPPKHLSPAEIGYLYDQTLDDREMWATLYDLQIRNIVKLEGTKIRPIATAEQLQKLTDYERIILRTKITKRNKFDQTSRMNFLTKVHNNLEKQGYYKTGYLTSLITIIVPSFCILALWPLLFTGIPGTSNGVPYEGWSLEAFTASFWMVIIFGFFLWPLYAFGSVYIASLIIKHAGIFWLGTKQLQTLWPELDGYREYLRQTDLDNAQFELSNQNPTAVKTLPYILALNLPIDHKE